MEFGFKPKEHWFYLQHVKKHWYIVLMLQNYSPEQPKWTSNHYCLHVLTGTRFQYGLSRQCSRKIFRWTIELRPWQRLTEIASIQLRYSSHFLETLQHSQTQPWVQEHDSPTWAVATRGAVSQISVFYPSECLCKCVNKRY